MSLQYYVCSNQQSFSASNINISIQFIINFKVYINNNIDGFISFIPVIPYISAESENLVSRLTKRHII